MTRLNTNEIMSNNRVWRKEEVAHIQWQQWQQPDTRGLQININQFTHLMTRSSKSTKTPITESGIHSNRLAPE